MNNFLHKVNGKLNYEIRKLKIVWMYLKNSLSPHSTYAQLQEDVVVELIVGNVRKFIDIGAYDGIRSSNTFLFALKGASGICFEPCYSNFSQLKQLYLLNRKVKCIPEGISDREQTLTLKSFGPFSSIEETKNIEHREIIKTKHKVDLSKASQEEISVHSLDYWLNQYQDFWEIDLMSIDVEGHELAVLKGIDFSRFKTQCFVIENNQKHRNKINSILQEAGYSAVLKNSINTFWINNEIINQEIINQIIITFEGYTKI
ncbi:MAG: FkbM family methyltransferase [Crocosphaera sp.]|nr:FkbM family methyltransferase [Crocosphaera sp.]